MKKALINYAIALAFLIVAIFLAVFGFWTNWLAVGAAGAILVAIIFGIIGTVTLVMSEEKKYKPEDNPPKAH
jgi:fatty acid desaturase